MKIVKSGFAVLLVTLVFGSLPVWAEQDRGFFANIGHKVYDEIETVIDGISVDTEVDLLDFDLFNGVNTAIRYGYALEPSYINENHTRFDKYIFALTVHPGSIFDLSSDGNGILPISFHIGAGTEIIFARQFPDLVKAASRIPYGLKNLPFTAKRAIHNLNVGDFVSFKAHLSFIVSAEAEIARDFVAIAPRTHYIISGEFQVHVYRMANHQVRLRLFALKQKKAGALVAVKFKPTITVFGVNLIDDAVERIFEFDMAKLELSKSKTNTLMADYIFHLQDAAAREVYDALFKNVMRIKNFENGGPLGASEKIKKLGLMSLAPVQKLFDIQSREIANGARKSGGRTIERKFLGEAEGSDSLQKFEFGLLLSRFEDSTLFSRYRLQRVTDEGKAENFVYSSYLNRDINKLDLKFAKLESMELSAAGGLFVADAKGSVDHFEEMVFTYELQDRILRESEQKNVICKLKRVLPEDILARIIMSEGRAGEEDKLSWRGKGLSEQKLMARVFCQIILLKPALEAVNDLSRAAINAALEDYLHLLDERGSLPSSAKPRKVKRAGRNAKLTSYQKRDRQKEDIVRLLRDAFDTTINKDTRLRTFEKLRRNALFRDIAGGFLIHLTRFFGADYTDNELFFVYVNLSAKNAKTVAYQSAGAKVDRSVYKALEYLQSIVNQREFDLRLIADDWALSSENKPQ